MKRKIITNLTELKKKSLDVSSEEVENIIKELEESLDTSKGVGLSAMQIGIFKRVSIIRVKDKEKINLINPVILEKEERFRFKREGCLSIPGLYIDTARYAFVFFESGLKDNRKRLMATGIEAIVVQHEIDHMDGLITLDRKWKKRR